MPVAWRENGSKRDQPQRVDAAAIPIDMGRRLTIVPATPNILPFSGHVPHIAPEVFIGPNAMVIGDLTIAAIPRSSTAASSTTTC